jgi:hypothetical protein
MGSTKNRDLFLGGTRDSSLQTCSGVNQPAIQWAAAAVCLGIRRHVREADRSPLSNVEFYESVSCTSSRVPSGTSALLIKYRAKIYLNFIHSAFFYKYINSYMGLYFDEFIYLNCTLNF